ncbi:hypothetical protein Tco_0905307 [Tanacetum coccineum]
MEAHCIALELKYQNEALKSRQHGQFFKDKSNEAKVKPDIDVIETINIELEHKVAKLLKENETLKKHYKELYDSIKTTRAKTIEQTTSLITTNADFKAQLQEKGFAIATLKMRHRFSIKKTSIVHEKTMTPRSRLRWKPTGRIFKTIGLSWVPTGKIFTSSTTKVNSEPLHGFNTDITNLHECIQTLDSSACTSINVHEEQTLDLSAGTPFNLKKERIKAWIKEHVISGRPRLHGIALIHEILLDKSPRGFEVYLLLDFILF